MAIFSIHLIPLEGLSPEKSVYQANTKIVCAHVLDVWSPRTPKRPGPAPSFSDALYALIHVADPNVASTAVIPHYRSLPAVVRTIMIFIIVLKRSLHFGQRIRKWISSKIGHRHVRNAKNEQHRHAFASHARGRDGLAFQGRFSLLIMGSTGLVRPLLG